MKKADLTKFDALIIEIDKQINELLKETKEEAEKVDASKKEVERLKGEKCK